MSIYDRMMNLDRRIIYTIFILIVVIIVIKPLGLPITVTADTTKFYNALDALEPGSVVWMDTSYGPGTIGELNPMVISALHQCFSSGYKVIIASTWTQGGTVAQNILDEIAPMYPDLQYGVDYVNLGFKPGGAAALLQQWQKDIVEAASGVDNNGKDLSTMPIIQEVPKLDKQYVDFIIVYETGSPGAIDYLTYVTQDQGIPLGVGIIAMSVPDTKPYLASGQYAAIIPGSRGAAEYEQLVQHPGKAIAAQDAISMSAMYAVLLIIIGNIGYLFLQNK